MKNIFILLSFLTFGLNECIAQQIKSTFKLSLDCKWEKDPEIFTDGYIPANGLGMYKSIGYELNFLKTSFIGLSTAIDGYGTLMGSNNNVDTAYVNTLMGKYEGRSEFKYLNFYLGSRIPTFKWCNQSFNFAVGVSRAKGYTVFVDRYTVYVNSDAKTAIWNVEGVGKDLNTLSPLIQAGYDFNLFKNWLNIGVDFRIRNYSGIGWQYNYGVTFGHNFKKILPHKEDFSSFADFVSVEKEEKERWTDVKEHKNTVTLEFSLPHFSYWGTNSLNVALPGISYHRKIGNHFVAGANFNLWIVTNEFYSDNGISNGRISDTSHVFLSSNYKTASLFGGYKLNIGQFGKQTLSLDAGISGTKGVNGKTKRVVGWYAYEIIDTKTTFLGPLLQLEYNINPLRNHLNLGVHARAKYYKFFGLEFDLGVHAGVNF